MNVATSFTEFDRIALSETWLHEGILNGELFVNDYCVFRKDRGLGFSRDRGVLLALRSDVLTEKLDLFCLTLVDSPIVAVVVLFFDFTIYKLFIFLLLFWLIAFRESLKCLHSTFPEIFLIWMTLILQMMVINDFLNVTGFFSV